MVWIMVCASGRRSIRSGIRFKFQLRMPRNNITILNSQVASEQERVHDYFSVTTDARMFQERFAAPESGS